MKEHLNLFFVFGFLEVLWLGCPPVARLEVEVAGIRLHIHPEPFRLRLNVNFRETPEIHVALH
jgi:hypothetical protein